MSCARVPLHDLVYQQVKLAVSLHAANDRERGELLPVNRRFPLSELMSACREYVDVSGRRMSFEWALIQGENDSPEVCMSFECVCIRARNIIYFVDDFLRACYCGRCDFSGDFLRFFCMFLVVAVYFYYRTSERKNASTAIPIDGVLECFMKSGRCCDSFAVMSYASADLPEPKARSVGGLCG